MWRRHMNRLLNETETLWSTSNGNQAKLLHLFCHNKHTMYTDTSYMHKFFDWSNISLCVNFELSSCISLCFFFFFVCFRSFKLHKYLFKSGDSLRNAWNGRNSWYQLILFLNLNWSRWEAIFRIPRFMRIWENKIFVVLFPVFHSPRDEFNLHIHMSILKFFHLFFIVRMPPNTTESFSKSKKNTRTFCIQNA